MRRKLFSFAFVLAVFSGAAQANVVSIGNGQFGTFCTPFCTQRFQSFYNNVNFGNDEIVITSFEFFVGSNFNANRSTTFNVFLGQASIQVGAMSATFANNILGNLTQVGTLAASGTYADGQSVGLSGLNFLYDPSLGDLVIDFQNTNVSGDSSQQLAGNFYGGFTPETSFVESRYPGSLTTALSSSSHGIGMLTRFNFSAPPPVPEPGMLELFGLGLIAVVGAARRRGTHAA